MPELPEVETVRAGLAPVMEGRTIVRAEARRADIRFPLPDRFVERLEGARVNQLRRRAKYLLADLDSGETLIAHLGMSGRFSVVTAQGGFGFGDYVYDTGADPKHDHVVFHLNDETSIIYNDPRRFGFMDLAFTDQLESARWFVAMGPEPLSNQFSGVVLAETLKSKKSPIKAALLDQKVVAGLGNIYVCEALFRSHIAPTRLGNSLTAPETELLALSIKAILAEAIGVGGSTLRDFKASDGTSGAFQERFDVYGREGQACTCGADVLRLVQSGRSTFWCSQCQV
jgi:formamidopyrimidine-DNA glycosylase